jgi:hypothetical protein
VKTEYHYVTIREDDAVPALPRVCKLHRDVPDVRSCTSCAHAAQGPERPLIYTDMLIGDYDDSRRSDHVRAFLIFDRPTAEHAHAELHAGRRPKWKFAT